MTRTQVPVAAFVALGSNLGDRSATLDAALDALRHTAGIDVVRVSSFLENAAVGGPANSPPFLNAVAEVRTTLAPRELLTRLLEIEHSLGRVRRERWEPRLIDLDLILYADQSIDEPGLTVPHPLMHARRFVLQQLAEIAPDFQHPTLHRTIVELLNDLGDEPVTSNE